MLGEAAEPLLMRRLLTMLAHAQAGLANYNQLATAMRYNSGKRVPVENSLRIPQLAIMARPQKAFGNPACFNIPFAVCRDLIAWSTGKWRCVSGLYQMSWSPFPERSREQPASVSSFFTSGV
jgi:hypothetical protein